MIVVYDGMNIIRIFLEEQNRSLRDIVNDQFNQHPGNVVIWTWEGINGNELRRKLYPKYKLNRSGRNYDNIIPQVNLFRSILELCPVIQVAVNGFEGDDVIANLVTKYREDMPVKLMSTDKDLRQLHHPNVTFFSTPKDQIPDTYLRLFKTLVGDSSDNIKGIPGFGEKAFHNIPELVKDSLIVAFDQGNFDVFKPEMGFKEKHLEWINLNIQEIKTMWDITGFFPISDEQIASGTKVGIPLREQAMEILEKFLL